MSKDEHNQPLIFCKLGMVEWIFPKVALQTISMKADIASRDHKAAKEFSQVGKKYKLR